MKTYMLLVMGIVLVAATGPEYQYLPPKYDFWDPKKSEGFLFSGKPQRLYTTTKETGYNRLLNLPMQDTPEVSAAKARHFAAVKEVSELAEAQAALRLLVERESDEIVFPSYAIYRDAYHSPRVSEYYAHFALDGYKHKYAH